MIRLIILIFTSAVLAILLYVVSLNPLPDMNIALKSFFILLIVLVIWLTIWQWGNFRYVFYKIKLSEEGIAYTNYLVFAYSQFYKWSDLAGYKADSYSLSYTSFDLVKLYVKKRCVLVLDEATISNFEELKSYIATKIEPI